MYILKLIIELHVTILNEQVI